MGIFPGSKPFLPRSIILKRAHMLYNATARMKNVYRTEYFLEQVFPKNLFFTRYCVSIPKRLLYNSWTTDDATLSMLVAYSSNFSVSSSFTTINVYVAPFDILYSIGPFLLFRLGILRGLK